MKTDLIHSYQTLADQYQSLSNAKKKQLKLISLARLISFLGIIPAFYYLNPANSILAGVVSLLLLATFLLLIKKFIQSEKQQLYYQRLVKINLDEISAINRDISAFDPGNEFIDPHHDYSYDLRFIWHWFHIPIPE